MSFTRIGYDVEAYKQGLNQSVGSHHYMFSRPNDHCKPCLNSNPSTAIQKNGVSVQTPLVDVNSELLGITRPASKDAKKQYIPGCNNSNTGYPCGGGIIGNVPHGPGGETLKHLDECKIKSQDSRLINPPCNLHGTGWNRWQWLHLNPQEKLDIPFEWNISNRIVVKDNHRPCIPKPLNQSSVLPNGTPYEDTNNYCFWKKI